MSDDASSGLEEGANIDRASLLKRLAIGGAALSLPSLAGAEAAFGSVQDVAASAAAVGRSTRSGSSPSSTTSRRTRSLSRRITAPPTRPRCSTSRYTWTRLDQGRRRRDDQRDQRGHQRQGRRHRRLRRRQGGVRGADQAGAGPGHPRPRYNADGARTGSKPGRRTSARISTSRGSRWASASSSSSPRGDVALFIATPGALNIQPRIDGALAAIKQFGQGT